MTRRIPVLSLAVLALAVLPALAQEPSAAFDEELEVSEVLLDVLVTDSRGQVILGLTPEDFIVEEEGSALPVTGATFYSNLRFADSGQVAERLGIDPNEVPVDRYFILFFDDPRRNDLSLTGNVLDAVRRAKQWVAEELEPRDWVAVVRYDAKLLVHQDFTTDNQAIERALNEVAKGKAPSELWPSRVELGDGPSLRVNLPQGKELQKETTRIYNALSTLADAAGYIQGRKNVIMLSRGFGEADDFETYTPDVRYYEPMMQSLNDNNVAVYAVSWFENRSEESDEEAVLANGMSQLASDTGGRYFFNFVDFRDPLSQVVEDNGGYYLLSFESRAPAGDSGYREIEVRTVNPDFVVRAREGYRYGAS